MGMFDIFKKKEHTYESMFQVLNKQISTFYSYNDRAFNNKAIREAINTNALNCGKLNPKHIRKNGDLLVENPETIIKQLLNRPNPYMSMFDFLQKMRSQYDEYNNAFAYIERDMYDNPCGIYPIPSNKIEAIKVKGKDELFMRFTFSRGKQIIVSYSELIHLRKHFNNDDIFGEKNTALTSDLEVSTIVNQGIVNAIKSGAFLRGVLKWKQVIDPEELKKKTNDFVSNYLNYQNSNGAIASTDPRFDFEETKNSSIVPNTDLKVAMQKELYSYFGLNEKIINSSYNENEWSAYYENVIETFGIQLSSEFTDKLFSSRKQGHGNMIIFEANRLQYAATTTKINLIKTLMPLGLFSINEGREIFNLSPVENGDKRIISLNYVNADKQDKYQDVDDQKEEGEENE